MQVQQVVARIAQTVGVVQVLATVVMVADLESGAAGTVYLQL